MIVLSEVSFQIHTTLSISCTLRFEFFYIKSIFFPNSSASLVTLNRDPFGPQNKILIDLQGIFHPSRAWQHFLKMHRPRKSSKMNVHISKYSEISRAFRDRCRRRQINIYGESLSSSKCNSSQQISTITNESRCQFPYHIEVFPWSRFPHRLLHLLVHDKINFKTVLWWNVSLGKRRSARWQFRSLDLWIYKYHFTSCSFDNRLFDRSKINPSTEEKYSNRNYNRIG